MLAITSVLVVAACEQDRKGGLTLEPTKCSDDSNCPGKQTCNEQVSADKQCACQVGRRGATCGFDTDCPTGETCDAIQCACVGPDSGLPPNPDDAGSTPDAEAGAPSPKACETNDECVRTCDCDGDGTMECSYTFACEDGACYEAPPDNGYSYATCERICLLHC